MAQLQPEQLLPLLENQAGESLRLVGQYTPDDYEIEYVRNDVRMHHETEEIEEILEQLRWSALRQHEREAMYDLGEHECTIQLFEHALVMNFPEETRAAGTVVTLDLEAASQLAGFVDEVQQRIEENDRLPTHRKSRRWVFAEHRLPAHVK